MAFSAVTERGSAVESVSDTTLGGSPSAALTVAKIVFVVVSTDNTQTTDGASTDHTSVTDTDGHTWTKVAERTNSAGAAADGVTGSLWWTLVTSEISTGDTITLTIGTARTAKAIGFFEVTVGAGNTIQLAASGSTFAEDDTSGGTALTLAGLPSKEYLFLGVWWRETNVITWTEDADYTNVYAAEGVATIVGGAGANVGFNVGSRIATLTGDTFDVGGLTTTQNAGALFAFEEVSAGGAATVTPAVVAIVTTVPTPTVLAAATVTPAVVGVLTTVPTPTIQAAATVTPAVVALVVTVPTPTVVGGVFGQTYIGTSTVGGSNLSMLETESYVKKVTLQAGWIVSHVEAFLRTTDNEFVTVHPVIYLDNAGNPGAMVVAPQFPASGVEFDGTDRWWPMATGYAVPTTGDYWVGVHAFTAGSLQIAHDAGPDQEVTSGGSWVNEAAGSGGGLTADGRNYSIRASIIAPTTITQVGRLTTGASNLDLGAEVRLIPVTITAGKVLLSVEADIKVHTASQPSIRGMLYSNNGGVPGIVLHAGPWATDSWQIANTYRRFSFPMGRWVETTDDYWIGVQMGDAGSIHLAFDGTGGSGGNLASDTDGATWTPESDNYSISGTLAA